MNLIHRMEEKTCVITLIGNLALSETANLRDYVQPLIHKETISHLLLNCKKVNIIDSRGVGLLAAILKDLEDLKKGFSLCALSEANYGIMDSLQLTQVIPVYSSEMEALSTIQA